MFFVSVAAAAADGKQAFHTGKGQDRTVDGGCGYRVKFQHHSGLVFFGAGVYPPQIISGILTEEKAGLNVPSQIRHRVVGKQEDNIVDRLDESIKRASQAGLGYDKHHELIVVSPVVDEMLNRLGDCLQIVQYNHVSGRDELQKVLWLAAAATAAQFVQSY